ncbi:MAG: GTPase ObgE [Deltaproteobacteria bacterium]|nr:GTPase ObgE [Deltaproteobacteria bacterium]
MAFIDEVTLQAKAGDGGNGIVAWRREAHVPMGGPAGGDGGDGGDVVIVADEGIHSLLDYRYQAHLRAKNGAPGRGKKQAGEQGLDVVAKVPIGTQVIDADTGELLADLTEHGQVCVACKGGNGGFGNQHFATPSRQGPDFAKPGLPGEERRLTLSLKLMADVGLLGFPNAGKSTLLSRVSAARPKIGNYPFTTLVPQLGVVRVDGEHSMVMADIPGLIEGAHQGAGLGIQFLKHLERVRVLCHLIEAPLPDLEEDADLVGRYRALREELVAYSTHLSELPEVVVLNKMDLLADRAAPAVEKLERHLDKLGVPLLFMSGVSGQGTREVVFALWREVRRDRGPVPAKVFSPFARVR